jgi:Uma2 family endonuclease
MSAIPKSPMPILVRYPDSDGKPMAENTRQFQWIVTIKEGTDDLFRDDPEVFVAGDLFWYPVEGDNTIRAAPDTLVAFGPRKGHRKSYRQWEEGGVAPQVVFEILSPGNGFTEMQRRFAFFQRHGVEEYYIYDPDENLLEGFLRNGKVLDEIAEMNGWLSPRLQIRFDMSGSELKLIRPDGQAYLTYAELANERIRERKRAEDEKKRAEDEKKRAEDEKKRAEKLAAQLRALGVEPDA